MDKRNQNTAFAAQKSDPHARIRPEYARVKPGRVIESQYCYFDTRPDPQREIAVVYAGHEICAPDFEIQRETYPWHVLEYTVKGLCELRINNRTHELRPGSIVCFSPGQRHHYQNTSSAPFEHYFIAFTGPASRQRLNAAGFDRQKTIPIAEPRRVGFLVESAVSLGTGRGEYAYELANNYLEILLLELAAAIRGRRAADSTSASRCRDCREYIDANFDRIRTPVDAANACHINIRYMSRLFRRYQNTTPQEYLKRLKLNKAASLLLSQDLSVKQVAYECGFSDPYYFSRLFRDVHGSSPKHYRRRHLGLRPTD